MKNKNTKMKKYQWIFILIITVFIAMWTYGNATHYFPNPISIGAGQYLDIATGIVIVSLLLSGGIIAILFKSKKKRR